MSDLPLPHNLKRLKVDELKDELSKRGLETTGIKKDLVDRLQASQDLAKSGGTEIAPLTDEVRDSAVSLKPAAPILGEPSVKPATPPHAPKSTSPAPPPAQDEGVGHVMVEGQPESLEEKHEKDGEVDIDLIKATQPAALDDEVAEIIAEDEAREDKDIPLSPPVIRSISPLPPSGPGSPMVLEDEPMVLEDEDERGDVMTPPMGIEDLPEISPVENKKRSREGDEEPSVPEPTPAKRRKPISTIPLPPKLAHLIHPPTSTLYITNLRRPFQHSSLHAYLSPSSSSLPPPRNPFSSPDQPGLWISGVKDHTYSTYPSVEDALVMAEKVEGVKWPEESGGELHVEFVDDEEVRRLVEREEWAWGNGRQKLTLRITKVEEGEDGDGDGRWDFELVGSGAVGPKPVLRPQQPVVRGNAPVGAPSGPSNPGLNGGLGRLGNLGRGGGLGMGMGIRGGANGIGLGTRGGANGLGLGIRGRGGAFGGQGPLGRNPNGLGDAPPRAAAGRELVTGSTEGRLALPLKRTAARPVLLWREGPGATA